MADEITGGFLRGERTDGQVGPLIVRGPAGSNSPVTGQVNDQAGTALTPKFAKLNQAASGTAQTLVAAVTGKKIRVLAAVFVAGGTATTLVFNSASTAISAVFANAANGGASLPFSPTGWFETVAGEALTVTTGAGSTTGIQVVYVEV